MHQLRFQSVGISLSLLPLWHFVAIELMTVHAIDYQAQRALVACVYESQSLQRVATPVSNDVERMHTRLRQGFARM